MSTSGSSSTSGLFPSTGRWRAGVGILTTVDRKRLPVIGSRIAKALASNSSAFKPAEMEQLEQVLSLSSEQLSLAIDTLTFIFQQAAYAQCTVSYVF